MGAGASVDENNKNKDETFDRIYPLQLTETEIDKKLAEADENERLYRKQVNAIRASLGKPSLEDQEKAKEMGEAYKKMKRAETQLEFDKKDFSDSKKDMPPELKYKRG